MSEEIKVGDRFQWGAKIWRIIGKRCASDSWDVLNEIDGDEQWMTSGWIRRHCTRLPPKEEFKPGDRFCATERGHEIVVTLKHRHDADSKYWWAHCSTGSSEGIFSEAQLGRFRRIEPEIELKAGARFQNVNTDVVWVLVRFVAEAPPRWLTVKEDPLGGDRVITVAQLQDRQMYRRTEVNVGDRFKGPSGTVWIIEKRHIDGGVWWLRREGCSFDHSAVGHEKSLLETCERLPPVGSPAPTPPEPTREQAEADLADKEFEVMRQVEFNKGDKHRQDAILTQMLAPLDARTFLLRGRG